MSKILMFWNTAYTREKNDRNLRLYKTLNGTTRGYNDVDLEINSDYTYGLQIILHTGRTTLIKKFNIKY